MSGLLNDKTLMDASGFHLKDEASKTAYLDKLEDAYRGLSPIDKAVVDSKLATVDKSDITAVAKVVDSVAGTDLASTVSTTAADTTAAFDASKAIDLKNGTYLTNSGSVVDAEGNTIRSTGSATTATLTNQILGQNLTDKWEGQGKGSAQANAADIATILNGIGVTDIKDFGVVPVYADVQELGKTYNGQRVFTSTDENTGQPFSYIVKPSGQYDQDGNETSTIVEVPSGAKLETMYGSI
jgi:hypothetical protein